MNINLSKTTTILPTQIAGFAEYTFNKRNKHLKEVVMKRLVLFFNIFMMLFASSLFAQDGKFSVGIVTSHYSDYDSDSHFSALDNPTGMGILVGYRISEDVSLALTSEFFTGDMENNTGSEDVIRTSLSGFFFPFNFNTVNPYLTAGAVLSNSNKDYDNGDSISNSKLMSRLGAGIDVPLVQRLSLNADLGFYGHNFKYTGWVQSLGLRFAF